MVLPNLKSNTELESGIIIALPNDYTKLPLEPAVDKKKQLDIIQI